MNKMKTIMDSLASIGEILSTRDQVHTSTSGLGHDYKSITMQITSNLNTYKLTNVIVLLLAHKIPLEQYNINISNVILTTNVAYQNPQKQFTHPD